MKSAQGLHNLKLTPEGSAECDMGNENMSFGTHRDRNTEWILGKMGVNVGK